VSITIVNCSLRLAVYFVGKKRYALMIAGYLRHRTQPVFRKLATITAKRNYTGASFYLVATPTNFTKIEHHLKVSYQADQRHRPYSLCHFLEHKAL
jgi:hypothetical protein